MKWNETYKHKKNDKTKKAKHPKNQCNLKRIAWKTVWHIQKEEKKTDKQINNRTDFPRIFFHLFFFIFLCLINFMRRSFYLFDCNRIVFDTAYKLHNRTIGTALLNQRQILSTATIQIRTYARTNLLTFTKIRT